VRFAGVRFRRCYVNRTRAYTMSTRQKDEGVHYVNVIRFVVARVDKRLWRGGLRSRRRGLCHRAWRICAEHRLCHRAWRICAEHRLRGSPAGAHSLRRAKSIVCEAVQRERAPCGEQGAIPNPERSCYTAGRARIPNVSVARRRDDRLCITYLKYILINKLYYV